MRPFVLLLSAGVAIVQVAPAQAYVALMAGQTAHPLNGRFNNIPVLHSNQPEEVWGPGILVNTAPGSAYSSEANQPLANATYTFDGDFGLHVHHKYKPIDDRRMGYGGRRRGELTLATILINPSGRPVTVRFTQGAVRNSFEAPYLPNYLMGVKPLGARPWNTGPGDATSVQMLRGRLDSRLSEAVQIPAYSRIVLFSTQLPAKGIANALLKGRSDGPFQMAVVAAEDPQSDQDILAVLDSAQLAPGRIYLSRIADIQTGRVFSRVAGVSIGDTYEASLNYDLSQGALHVPLTSTSRHDFGTREVQVNPLVSRMVDSSLDNVGTYGVRYQITFNLRGSGPYELVLSHPVPNGPDFTAFRGSIAIETPDGLQEVHVGMRSGESLPLASLNLQPGQTQQVKISMVYPADATPGHLLSVVPSSQMAGLRQQQQQLAMARRAATAAAMAPVPPPPATATTVGLLFPAPVPPLPSTGALEPSRPRPPVARLPYATLGAAGRPGVMLPRWIQPLPPIAQPDPVVLRPGHGGVAVSLPSAVISPSRMSQSLMERYQQAVEAQQQFMKSLTGR